MEYSEVGVKHQSINIVKIYKIKRQIFKMTETRERQEWLKVKHLKGCHLTNKNTTMLQIDPFKSHLKKEITWPEKKMINTIIIWHQDEILDNLTKNHVKLKYYLIFYALRSYKSWFVFVIHQGCRYKVSRIYTTYYKQSIVDQFYQSNLFPM